MRRNSRLFFLLTACLSLSAAACRQEDLTPAFLEIEYDDINGRGRIDLSEYNSRHATNYDAEELEALAQHDFTHANVFVDGKNLGCWELPCKVPVLDVEEGDSSQVVVVPCFRKTGMAHTVQGYPFFDIVKQRLLLEKGRTFDLSDSPPSYVYSPYVRIPYLETFSNSSSFVPNDTAVNRLTFMPSLRDGRHVGELVLNADGALSFDVAASGIRVPAIGHYVYLEMTYNIEAPLEIGVKLSASPGGRVVHQIGGAYSTGGRWKTICFDLTGIVSGYHVSGGAESELSLILTGIGDEGGDTRYSIDNIKIIVLKSS